MKITLVMVTSSDGYIASDTHTHSFKWNSKEDKQFFKKISKEIGTVIMGSSTFSVNEQYVLPERLNVVLTNNPQKFKEQDNLIFLSGKPEEIVEELEGRGIEHACLIGGANVNTQFLEANLIDDGYITIEPIQFGSGIKMFAQEAKYTVVSEERLNEGGTILKYVKFK